MIATIKTLKRQLFPEGSFVANVLILMTGTTIAQAIPIVASPIITRIYAPDEFGTFALYMAIVSIVSVMATGKYELAVMLPEKEEDAINLVALSIFLSSFVSLTALGTIWIFNEPIIKIYRQSGDFRMAIFGSFSSYNNGHLCYFQLLVK